MRHIFDRRRFQRRKTDEAQEGTEGHLRKMLTGAVACWAILATIAAIALAIQQSHDTSALHAATRAVNTSKKTSVRLRVQQQQGCERANVQRALANSSYAAQYTIDDFVVRRFLVPTKTETGAQRRITSEFAPALKEAVKEQKWTRLTNCVLALSQNGPYYKAPEPVSFSVSSPPPSALDVVNASLPAPVGSVP